MPGFPIRTSSDQRSVDSSPRHIAASHVLHRLPVPRHPPCALKHLQHKKPFQRKNYTTTNHTPTPNPNGPNARRNPHPHRGQTPHVRPDARNHYPQIKHHTPPPRWSDNTPPTPRRGQRKTGLLPQDPTVCLAAPIEPHPHASAPPTGYMFVAHPPATHYRRRLALPTTMKSLPIEDRRWGNRYRCSLERR